MIKKFRIYLDLCSFNRPFDDHSSIMIKLEAEAKLYIQRKIDEGELELIWSYILDYENAFNPDKGKRLQVSKWKSKAVEFIEESKELIEKIKNLGKITISGKDAIHVASAILAKSDYFITTDYRLIKKCRTVKEIAVVNPIDFIKQTEKIYEND